jgi:hypothetical protein
MLAEIQAAVASLKQAEYREITLRNATPPLA